MNRTGQRVWTRKDRRQWIRAARKVLADPNATPASKARAREAIAYFQPGRR